VEINNCHQRMLTLMRGFAPPQASRKARAEPPDLQATLF